MKLMFVISILLLLTPLCYGQDKSLGQRVSEAEYTFYQTAIRVDVMYDMVKTLYLEKHTEEEYEDLVFNARNTKETEEK